jgi:DNA-binding response OmpR family regulator
MGNFFNREKKRILFVDDDQDNWELVALDLAECVVVCARNFNEGLRLAQAGYFDLYLLDNWLPDGTGVELCRAIREFDPHTPVLFYSAAAYACDKREATRAGAQMYLTKPVQPNELSLAVTRLISATSKSVFEARLAEIAAVRKEWAIQRAENAEQMEREREKRQRSKEKALRDIAQSAFLTAGGTRGEFARRWLSLLTEEVRDRRTSDAASGH